MLRHGVAILAFAGCFAAGLAGTSGAADGDTAIRVSPKVGDQRATFVLRFTAPRSVEAESGTYYDATVRGPKGRGCVRTGTASTNDGDVRGTVGKGGTVKLKLARSSRRWCRGLYRGTVFYTESCVSSSCEEEGAEPDPPPERVGGFTFRVRR